MHLPLPNLSFSSRSSSSATTTSSTSHSSSRPRSKCSYTALSVLALAALPSLTSAQQYAGEKFHGNNMTDVDGAEIAYFNINDTSDSSKNGTLVNYYSLDHSGDQLDPEKIHRAVILIHGASRDPWTYAKHGLHGLDTVNQSGINRNHVAIFAPYFANNDDAGDVYPWDDGPTTNALVWQDADWINGDDAIYPKKLDGISTFDVLDQIIQYFDNKTEFPNMNQIVVGGHSGGSQMTQRYAAVGMDFETESPVTFFIANPDSWLWMSAERPLSYTDCDSYDDWRYGLDNYTIRYGDSFVSKGGRDAVWKRYKNRKFAYARGMQDFGDMSVSCATWSTGNNRGERFYNFMNVFPVTCDDGAGTTCSTIDYMWDIGHSATDMISSVPAVTRLYVDNFSGNGTQAYDFGYPRVQPSDDPFPNPDYATGKVTDLSGILNTTNATFAGCWTDTSDKESPMEYRLYNNWDKNLTIGSCTSGCKAKGYMLAGLRSGTDCYCSQDINSTSYHTADGGCYETCGGDESQVCGASRRTSVYNLSSEAVYRSSGGASGNNVSSSDGGETGGSGGGGSSKSDAGKFGVGMVNILGTVGLVGFGLWVL